MRLSISRANPTATALTKPQLLMWFVLWLALVGGNYMVYNLFFPLKVLHHVIITALLLYMLLRRDLTRSPLLGPVLVMGGVVALSTLTAIDPRVASEALWHWISNLLLFLCAIHWLREGHEASLFTAHFFVGGLLAASCLLQWALTGGRPGGIFLVINLAGAYAAALVVPTFVHTDRGSVWSTILMGGLLGILCLTVVLNQSRGALISVLVSLMVFVLIAVTQTMRRRILVLVAGLGLILGGVTVLALIGPGHVAGDVDRLRLWGVAGQIFENYPNGTGPGLFAQAVRGISPADINEQFTGAHNHYLTTMSELGYPGLAAGAVLLLVVVYSIPRERTVYQNASLAALVGLMVHMLFDNYPAQNWTFLVSLYTAHLVYQAEWPETLPRFKWLSYPIAAVLVVFAVALIKWDYAESLYLQSIMTGDVALARRAAESDDNRFYEINLALMNGESASRLDTTITSQTDLTAYALTNFGRIYLPSP